MANNVFSRAQNQFAGAFSADGAALSFAGGVVGLVTQSLSVNFSQNISQLFELGSDKTYFIIGRARGQMQLSKVLGPAALSTVFYTKFGDGCNIANNTIAFSVNGTCGTQDNGTLNVTVKYAVIVSLGLSVGAQDMIIQEGISLMFTSLEYSV